MLKLNVIRIERIKGNEPILLDDTETVWVVQSGSLVLFATQVEAKQPKGHRQYLFSVSAGEALFGTALSSSSTADASSRRVPQARLANPSLTEQRCIMAVAVEETELLRLSLSDLTAQVAAANPEAIALLEGWIHHLGEWVSIQQKLTTPVDMLKTEGSHYLSLLQGQALQPKPKTLVWVQVQQGITRYMGVEELELNQTSPVFPLAPNMWLEAEKQVEVYATSTAQLEHTDALPSSITLLHAYFFNYLNLLAIRENEAKFRRFQERERLNRQVSETALGDLATVLQRSNATSFQEGTGAPLLIAAGAVGRAMGITIHPPAQSKDLSRVKEPLEAIAQASQFRTRRVLLVGEWWRSEHGPLLAYTQSDSSPVALLPDKNSRYILFDPVKRTRTQVTASVAEMLSPEAQMFYRPLPLEVSNIAVLFRFGTKGYEKDLVAVVLIGMMGTLLGMVAPQATAILVNNVIPDSDRVQLWQIGLALFAAAFGQAAFQITQAILTLRVENSADGVLQPAVWNRLLTLKPAFFRNYSSGDLLTRLLAVNQIRSQLSGATQRTLLSAVFSLLNLGLMFVYSWQLALVGMGITFMAVILTVISGALLLRKDRQMEVINGEINGLTVELINGVSKLRVAAAEGRAFAAWAKKYRNRIQLKLSIQRIDDVVSVFNEVLSLVSTVLVFGLAIVFMQMAQRQGGAGLNMGTFLAFNAAFGTFISGVTDLSNTLTNIIGIVPLWERAKPILQGMPESDATKAEPGRLNGQIALSHITFRYREDGPLILEDVSIHIEPGEFVAIVGPSGSGKSTIFRLLLGFEAPLSGSVYYDDQDLTGLDVQAVRRQLGVVLQNGRISAGSLFDNLTCGALVTLDEAWDAARMAGLAEDIEQMPMGMHTVVSEGGTNLSGGQRQRLLIARSLIGKPKIILMDEATSALDNRTQAIVTQSLDKLNVTRVVIAHRLSTIRNADRIYVIEAGRLVEVGSFEELVNLGGLFSRLVARQLE